MRQKFNLYSTYSFPLFKDYIGTRRCEYEDENGLTEDQVRDTDLKKYNNLLTSGRWSNNDPKDAHILYLVRVSQKLADEPNKSSDKSNTSNRESTKG